MGACMLLGGKHIDKNSTLKKTKIVMAIPFDNIPQKDILMVEKEVNKIVEKKFVRIGEGSMTYSIGHHRFIEMARAAGAVYKIGEAKGNTILINLEVFDEYMEQFREPPTEMKHPLPNVKGD